MTSTYRVFIAVEVVANLRGCRSREKRLITQLLDELAQNPFRAGDYVEHDEVGRPIQVLIVGGLAVCFWADHAVKEVKVVDLRSAGR